MKVSQRLKPLLYKKPNPLFIWGEGSADSGVWTAASLYWGLRNLEDSQFRLELAGHEFVSYDLFPTLLLELLTHNSLHIEAAVAHQAQNEIWIIGHNSLAGDFIRNSSWIAFIDSLLNNRIAEAHFVSSLESERHLAKNIEKSKIVSGPGA